MGTGDYRERVKIRTVIEEIVPERCQPCYRPYFKADTLAGCVMAEQITLEAAKTDLAADLEKNCELGQGVEGGCAGNQTICGYGGREFTATELMLLGL